MGGREGVEEGREGKGWRGGREVGRGEERGREGGREGGRGPNVISRHRTSSGSF